MVTVSSTARSPASWTGLDEWAKARLRWELLTRTDRTTGGSHDRPEQRTPKGDWLAWFYCAGRGAGKTRAGAEDVSDFCRRNPRSLVALVAPTIASVRDTMVEGESGLLAVLPPSALRGGSRDSAWNRSTSELFLSNGCELVGFSSEKPGRLRGPQHHRAWLDEPAELKDAARGDALDSTWNNLMMGLRLGERPQAVLTGTPKSSTLVRQLLSRPDVVVTRGSTYDNLANLAPNFRERVLSRYEGTRLARQELLAELIDDVEGALLSQATLDATRVEAAPDMRRVVVAVDPSWGTTGDECGIVVAGLGVDGHGYVLDDRSVRAAPAVWGAQVADAYRTWQADRIVAEVNFQAEQVRMVMRTVDLKLSFKELRASRGKQQRAEPVVALYELGRVHHVGQLPGLEDQWTSWVPGQSAFSPDRVDACVVEGTLVETSDGPVPIEDVHEGAFVWTRAGLRPVLRSALTNPSAAVLRLRTSVGDVELTPDHRVWVEGRGFVRADAVAAPTDSEGTSDARHARSAALSFGGASTGSSPRLALANVERVCVVAEPKPVYDLTVEGQPEFFAGGLLVHNCVWALTELMLSATGASVTTGHLRSGARVPTGVTSSARRIGMLTGVHGEPDRR